MLRILLELFNVIVISQYYLVVFGDFSLSSAESQQRQSNVGNVPNEMRKNYWNEKKLPDNTGDIFYNEKKPKIISNLRDMKVLREQQAIFICTTDGNPVPQIRWTVNGKDNLPSRFSALNVSPKQSVLRLTSTTLSDNHTRITCQASNTMGSSYSHATITVYKDENVLPAGFPKLISKSSIIVNEKNSHVQLECMVMGKPQPHIMWLKNNLPVDLENPRIKLLDSGTLEILKTLEEDDGHYECIATNSHGTVVSPVMRLMIREDVESTYRHLMKTVSHFSPQIVYITKDQTINPGSKVTIKCRAVGLPAPSIIWKCGQTILRPRSTNETAETSEAVVVLSDLSESLNCSCTAKNPRQSTVRTVRVIVRETSSTSVDIRVSHITGNSCFVTWEQKDSVGIDLDFVINVAAVEDMKINKDVKKSYKASIKSKLDITSGTIKVTDLQPFTNYNVWLDSLSSSGALKPKSVNFSTIELPPSSPPTNVEIYAVSNGAVAVSWEAPEKPNGLILSYRIYYTQYQSKPLALWNKYVHTSQPDKRIQMSVLSHLTANAVYYICLNAQNRMGDGPVTDSFSILVKAGVVQAPTEFRAMPKSFSEIQLSWKPPVPRSLTEIKQYKLEYRQKNEKMVVQKKVWNYSKQFNKIIVDQLKPNTTYVFNLSTITSSAMGMSASVECTTSVRDPDEVSMVIVNVLNSTAISVSWNMTNQMPFDIKAYRIQCRTYENATGNTKMVDRYLKINDKNLLKKNGYYYYVFNSLNPNTAYQVFFNTITPRYISAVFKSRMVKTWPKKLDKVKYLHLLLACSILNPCVKLSWEPQQHEKDLIKGYRIRFHPISNETSMRNIETIERNTTATELETFPFEHYQGFNYQFGIAAFSKYEIGEERLSQIFVLEGVPTAAPSRFTMKKSPLDEPTSATFHWEKLPQQALNGKLTNYQMNCSIIGQEPELPLIFNTTTESIVVSKLKENTNYKCSIRVCIRSAAGPWSNPIIFKTKEANLPPPDQIRLVRLSHTSAQITWRWKPDFLIYYSHFLVYYFNEKELSDETSWMTKPTKSAFTKLQLSKLNATISYSVKVSSVSKRGIEGPLSNPISEVALVSNSWPAKMVSQLSCATQSSKEIELRWSTDFQIEEVTHFRVNYSGTATVQLASNVSALHREEMEQSALITSYNQYYAHKIQYLTPNTKYLISVEPIFQSTSIMIGTQSEVECTTSRELPSSIPKVILVNINKEKQTMEVLMNQPNLENGTIDVYYVLVTRTRKPSVQILDQSRLFINENYVNDKIERSDTNETSLENEYITATLNHTDIFTRTKYHLLLIGSGKKVGSAINKKLDPNALYHIKVLACITISDYFNKRSVSCADSDWSEPMSFNISISSQAKELLNDIMKNQDRHKQSSGPSTFTTATVVMILGLVILTIFGMFVFFFVKRKRLLKSKFSNIYGIHNRNEKEKLFCMDQVLKEPLVNSSSRISASGSLRFTNSGSNFYGTKKTQLSSTPDLLVRSSVQPPISSLIHFHETTDSARNFEKGPIAIEMLGDHVLRLKETDSRLFSAEYESIESGQQFTWLNSNLDINRPKNRYANVIAYDHSRVVLQPFYDSKNSRTNEPELVIGSDYINANFINGYMKQKAYIATQGPLAETIGDFWRMVWEQDSKVIVMMTRLEERDRSKCDQYWPVGGKGSIATYSYVNVTLSDVIELAYYTIRKFIIQKAGGFEVREVYQLQFTAWPDHGVPNHPAPLLMFMRRIRAETPRNSGPIIVHCSAGVGRTGAFIVIDCMLERIRYEATVDIYNYVANIRAQRNYMVQTEDQYIFIHEVLLEAINCGNTEVPVSELAIHIEKLNQIEISYVSTDSVQMTGLQMEFEKLLSTSQSLFQGSKLTAGAANQSHCSTPSTTYANYLTNYTPLTYDTANQIVNQMKNRIIQILPPDFCRVSLTPIRGVEGSDYINASWIDGYKCRKAYIAAQSPLQETCEDFWRMIWEHKSSIIVMLTKLQDGNRERCHQYWPSQTSANYHYFIVDAVAEYDMLTYLIREFRVSDTRNAQSRVIRQFQFVDWRGAESIPNSTQTLLDLINQVHKTKAQLGLDGPITVHCSAGTGKTGLFLALANIIERMKNESVVDLFQTIKLLRWQRPALLQTEDQYQFCYTAALEYLRVYEQANFG